MAISETVGDKKKSSQKKGTSLPVDGILIKGARVHNLKNITVTFPRNKFIVVTGVSGSGKSSLTINTLFAEGQRRYAESLSAYARQFMARMVKPDVDYIKGLCPAIAIEQKVITRTPRSTVGSMTEIYDYLRLLFARIGKTISPVSGREVKKDDTTDVIKAIQQTPPASKVVILAPFKQHVKRDVKEELNILVQKGFSRIYSRQSAVGSQSPVDSQQSGEIFRIEDLLDKDDKELLSVINLQSSVISHQSSFSKRSPSDISHQSSVINKLQTTNYKPQTFILIDRIVTKDFDEDDLHRIADSIGIAFYEGEGEMDIEINPASGLQNLLHFSNKFELDGITFEEPVPNLFSFNNPFGACPTCEGFSLVLGIDPDLVIPDKTLSVYEGAIAPWKGEKLSLWKEQFIRGARSIDFPVHKAIADLSPQQYEMLWTGAGKVLGINDFFKEVEQNLYKVQYRVLLSRYRGRTICSSCKGYRLRKEALYVKVSDKNIGELCELPIKDLAQWFQQLLLSEHEQQIAKRILLEINQRLQTLLHVGLGYLTLNRLANSLSGGESQRIQLTRSLGSNLTNSLYILDEPSIGLHSRDTENLIVVLKQLRDEGNTIVVVEHDEMMMRHADYIIDMGPLASHLGGEVVAFGDYDEIISNHKSLTGKYLKGELCIPVPDAVRVWKRSIKVEGARQNNLKNIDVEFPLNILCVVSGVSGSGKTTLVKQILYPALKKLKGEFADKSGFHRAITGDIDMIDEIELIDQNPIGKSSRSNPVTYIKAWDEIRDLFAKQPLAKMRGFQAKHFSFNVDGGRCDACKGEGEQLVEMQFLADIHLTCEVCGGKKFKEEVLEVQYKGKNVYDVLEMSVDDAILFFSSSIVRKNNKRRLSPSSPTVGGREGAALKPLQDVGLGYIKLGQSSDTLSGGEAQRVKLASFLGRGRATSKILFIFDEPTTGLHFHDIQKLLASFNALIKQGHSIIVIEHNTQVIKCADWVIDLGPEAGDEGGNLVFAGTPDDLKNVKGSYTGTFL
ncbi:MAG: excinuclease ABC subunit UvrA [Parafilimonas sp.]